jgi:hypothetical protein
VYLAASLPATSRVHDRVAWVGFDVGEVIMLSVTAYLAWSGKPKVALAATALATMLVVDAWFDVNTSTAGAERDMALGFAVLEVSLAAVSLWIAFHAAAVARRRIEELARREAERDIRRTLPSHHRPSRLTDLAGWTRDRPGQLAEAVAPSGDDADWSAAEPAQAARSRSRKAGGRARRVARDPRYIGSARSRARKHIRRYVPAKRRPAAADLAD